MTAASATWLRDICNVKDVMLQGRILPALNISMSARASQADAPEACIGSDGLYV